MSPFKLVFGETQEELAKQAYYRTMPVLVDEQVKPAEWVKHSKKEAPVPLPPSKKFTLQAVEQVKQGWVNPRSRKDRK
jgi:hypothetical protein